MLNDLSTPTRRLVVAEAMSLGLFLGLILVSDVSGNAGVSIGIMLSALVLFVSSSFTFVVWSRRAQTRLVSDTAAGSHAIVRGQVDPVLAAGRTVRTRAVMSASGFLASGPEPLEGPASIIVATALAADGPRRVAFLAPTSVASNLDGAFVALRLHPTMREVALLDDLVRPEQLAAIAADPRWRSSKLPTDRSVVGGWLPLLGSMCLGVTAGCGLVAIIAPAFT